MTRSVEGKEVDSQPTHSSPPVSEELMTAGADHIGAAHEFLHEALEQMTWARVRLSGLGADPARALSVAITQCETTMLWLEKARAQVWP